MSADTSAPTLVIMAAGLGTRYGGFKQVDRIGPSGEMLLEYAIFDARRAGFRRVVFIVRRELVEAFDGLMRTLPPDLDVSWVVQDPDVLPGTFSRPPARTKPWGTVHALLATRDAVDGAFAAVNADDFYGRSAYAQALDACADAERANVATIIGLPLDATLSEHGPVVRGFWRFEQGTVVDLEEVYDVVKADGQVTGRTGAGEPRRLSGRELASMNFWVLGPAVFTPLEERFGEFLSARENELTAELPLPDAVGQLIRRGAIRVRAREAPGPWFGLTHQRDRPKASEGLRALVELGEYPSPLWQV
jgi:hypothetical protein